jgi:hypothetical protein
MLKELSESRLRISGEKDENDSSYTILVKR